MILPGGKTNQKTVVQYGVLYDDWIYVAKSEEDARATQRCTGGKVVGRTWSCTGWLPVDA